EHLQAGRRQTEESGRQAGRDLALDGTAVRGGEQGDVLRHGTPHGPASGYARASSVIPTPRSGQYAALWARFNTEFTALEAVAHGGRQSGVAAGLRGARTPSCIKGLRK